MRPVGEEAGNSALRNLTLVGAENILDENFGNFGFYIIKFLVPQINKCPISFVAVEPRDELGYYLVLILPLRFEAFRKGSFKSMSESPAENEIDRRSIGT